MRGKIIYSYLLTPYESKMHLRAAASFANSPEVIICTARLPIAVAFEGPAYTVLPVYCAVSLFRYPALKPPPTILMQVSAVLILHKL